MSWLKDILTGPDNKTIDLVRVITFKAALIGNGLQLFVVLSKGQAFDFTSYGTGLGLIIGAGAAGMWARKDVEKPQ